MPAIRLIEIPEYQSYTDFIIWALSLFGAKA
jgi:hypothetical protein